MTEKQGICDGLSQSMRSEMILEMIQTLSRTAEEAVSGLSLLEFRF